MLAITQVCSGHRSNRASKLAPTMFSRRLSEPLWFKIFAVAVVVYAATNRNRVISDGAPKRFGGPQYPVPRLV